MRRVCFFDAEEIRGCDLLEGRQFVGERPRRGGDSGDSSHSLPS